MPAAAVIPAPVADIRVDVGRLRGVGRRLKGMWSAQSYSESPCVQREPFGFDLITAPLRESRLCACISSRITAVIQVTFYYPVD